MHPIKAPVHHVVRGTANATPADHLVADDGVEWASDSCERAIRVAPHGCAAFVLKEETNAIDVGSHLVWHPRHVQPRLRVVIVDMERKLEGSIPLKRSLPDGVQIAFCTAVPRADHSEYATAHGGERNDLKRHLTAAGRNEDQIRSEQRRSVPVCMSAQLVGITDANDAGRFVAGVSQHGHLDVLLHIEGRDEVLCNP